LVDQGHPFAPRNYLFSPHDGADEKSGLVPRDPLTDNLALNRSRPVVDYPKMNNIDLVSPYDCYSPEGCWKLPVVRGFIACARAVDITRQSETTTLRKLLGSSNSTTTTPAPVASTPDLVRPMCWESNAHEIVFRNLDNAPKSERTRLVDGYKSCRALYDEHLIYLEQQRLAYLARMNRSVTNITFVFHNATNVTSSYMLAALDDNDDDDDMVMAINLNNATNVTANTTMVINLDVTNSNLNLTHHLNNLSEFVVNYTNITNVVHLHAGVHVPYEPVTCYVADDIYSYGNNSNTDAHIDTWTTVTFKGFVNGMGGVSDFSEGALDN
jgi:hypothetical protein